MPTKTKELFEYGRTRREIDKLFQAQAEYMQVVDAFHDPVRGTSRWMALQQDVV